MPLKLSHAARYKPRCCGSVQEELRVTMTHLRRAEVISQHFYDEGLFLPSCKQMCLGMWPDRVCTDSTPPTHTAFCFSNAPI